MKKFTFSLLLNLALTVIISQSFAQNKFSVRYFEQIRMESQLSYSFFTGPDASSFRTSINGFGSGILDVLGIRASSDLVDIGSDKLYLSLGAGFSVIKYRFAENLVFSKSSDNIVSVHPDTDLTHDYVNTFFGYGKSKLITTSFYFPVDINMAVGKNVLVTAGGYLDLNLTARYRMKYLVGEDKVKEIIRSSEFRNLNPNTIKFGINFTILHKKLGYGLSASYSLSPFFKAGLGPDIHEARVSASYTIRNLKEVNRKKEQ